MSVFLDGHKGHDVNPGHGAYSDFYDSPKPEQKHSEDKDLLRFQTDALSDEDFQNLYLAQFRDDALTDEDFQRLVPPPTIVDKVENRTIAILTNLATLADGFDRQDIVGATVTATVDDHSVDFLKDDQSDDFYHEHRFNPFRRDTNFDDQGHMEQPANTLKAIKNLVTALATVLFGVEFSKKGNNDQRSLEQLEDNFKSDKAIWNKDLSKQYKDYFDRNMNETFSRAEILINERRYYRKIVYYQRVTLCATTILAATGLITGKKALTYIGLSASLITFIYMIALYGSSSFKLANLASEIQTSTGFLEKIGSTYRIRSNPFMQDIPD